MSPQEYVQYLTKIDVAIFFHSTQEAMGVTIQLLSVGKPIYFNPLSPSYLSLKKRGYAVFNTFELCQNENLLNFDLSNNRLLLKKEYSLDVLNNFYKNL